MENHLSKSHELPFLQLGLWEMTHISKEEEGLMGIPQIQMDTWREHYQVLDSEDVRVTTHSQT